MRARFYIDGFNFYHGLVEHSRARKYKWVDFCGLCRSLLPASDTLEKVLYFTSMSRDPARARRQQTFLDALETTGVEVIKGRFQDDWATCGAKCRLPYQVPVEKHTDVNISTRLLTDAFSNHFDEAYLITGDADQVPTVAALKIIAPSKRLHVRFPPRRISEELEKCSASPAFQIGHKPIRKHQLPLTITVGKRIIQRPNEWDPANL